MRLIPAALVNRLLAAARRYPPPDVYVPNLELFLHPDIPADLQLAIVRHFPLREWGNAAAVARYEGGWERRARVHDKFIHRIGDKTWGPAHIRVRDGYPHDPQPPPPGWHIVKEDSRGHFMINIERNANPQYADWNLFDTETNVRAAREIYDARRITEGPTGGWLAWTAALPSQHDIRSIP